MATNYRQHLEQWVNETVKLRQDGDAYASGFLYSTLAHALEDLERHDPDRAKQLLTRFTLLDI